MAIELEHIDLDLLCPLWPRIENALQERSFDPRLLFRIRCALLTGTHDLWVARNPAYPWRFQGIIITTVISQPRRPKVLEVDLVGGRNIGQWIESTASTLGRFAQANGCTHIWVYGRSGWKRYQRFFPLPVTWTLERECSRANHDDRQHTNLKKHQRTKSVTA